MKNIILKKMVRLKVKKIFPISLGVTLAIVLIAGVYSFIPELSSRKIVDSSGSEALLGISADSEVRMVIRGSIVADEDFRVYQLSINPNKRRLVSTKGYIGQPTILITEDNNLPAYEQLVYALDKANFAKSAALSGSANDLRGICAAGRVYDFQILEKGKVIKNYWTSTCSGSKGSLNANLEQVSDLFFYQIRKSKDIVSQLWR